jgi:predicted dehydrogenase
VLDLLAPIAQDCAIAVSPDSKLPVAVIGAGSIVDAAHLPTYRALGIEIAGIFDLDAARARAVAARHGIDRVYGTLDEALEDQRAGFVDIAVVPWAQPEIVTAALTNGKHVLCQKPLALSVAEAQALAAAADASDRCVVVNQQLRYDEGIAVMRSMLQRGWIGEPTTLTFSVDIATDWSSWQWLVDSERLDLLYHSIHYLDAVRSLLGEPDVVFCTLSRTPGQLATGETRSISTLIFPGGVRALVHVNHENRSGDPSATFRLDGSDGSIVGSLGLLLDYPHGRPDTLAVRSLALPTDGWLNYPITERWLPNAFAGPVAALLQWASGGAAAPTNAADNVRTVQLVNALYRSDETGSSQDLRK